MTKIEISKEWCLRAAQNEGDHEVGAGALAMDPVLEPIPAGVIYSAEHDNFYDTAGHGLGEAFYLHWRDMKALFPSPAGEERTDDNL